MLILNVPGWFGFLFNIVKPLLNDAQKAKINIFRAHEVNVFGVRGKRLKPFSAPQRGTNLFYLAARFQICCQSIFAYVTNAMLGCSLACEGARGHAKRHRRRSNPTRVRRQLPGCAWAHGKRTGDAAAGNGKKYTRGYLDLSEIKLLPHLLRNLSLSPLLCMYVSLCFDVFVHSFVHVCFFRCLPTSPVRALNS